MFGVDIGFEYIVPRESIDTFNTSNLKINPYYSKKNNEYEFLVGIKIITLNGDMNKTFFYPEGYLQFNVVEKILVSYLGIDGKVTINNYEKLASENPYIRPVSFSEYTDMLFAYGGIKGKFNITSGFNFGAS